VLHLGVSVVRLALGLGEGYFTVSLAVG